MPQDDRIDANFVNAGAVGTSTIPQFVHPGVGLPPPSMFAFMPLADARDKPVEQAAPKSRDLGIEMPYQAPPQKVNFTPVYVALAFLALLGVATLGLVAWDSQRITEISRDNKSTMISAPTTTDRGDWSSRKSALSGSNVCAGAKPDLPNIDCLENEIGEQSAIDVTVGVEGNKATDAMPITTSYWKAGLCPVNVHWHQGTEHRSAGQYDETGSGPANPPSWDGKGRQGFQCTAYNANDAKFTTEYQWQHCTHMEVGETYEVHWPHSAAGACGTPNQYQTPFYDGVFCFAGELTSTPAQIGVQAQTFIVVNDESYYVPNLIDGMLVDGKFGEDMAFYTGSTTGDSRSNEMCSQYTPITWQVDRTCHMISASSFDKMCADMKTKRDDMSSDLHPHGSRPLVDAKFSAANLMSGTMVDGRVTMDATPAP